MSKRRSRRASTPARHAVSAHEASSRSQEGSGPSGQSHTAGGPEDRRSQAAVLRGLPVAYWWLTLLGGLAVVTVVYLAMVNPTIPPGDSGDLITAAVVFGIAHPPGYPLLTILGHVASLVPIGSPAFRVNVLSAVFGVGSVGITALLIAHLTARWQGRELVISTWASGAAALGGALLLAFSTQFWLYSLVTEVFALNAFFAAALLFTAVAWYRNPERMWAFRLFCLSAGLAMSNQQTIVALGPGLLIVLIAGMRRRQHGKWLPDAVMRREVLIGVALIAVGLLPYLYLPIAALGDPAINWGDPRTLDAFVRLVTRADYGTGQLIAGGAHGSVSDNLSLFGAYLAGAFGPVGCGLALVGLWWLARSRPAVAIGIATCFLVAGPIFLAYANPPTPAGLLRGVIARFYILPSVPFAVFAGCGAYQMWSWLASIPGRARRPSLAPIGVGLAILVLLAQPIASAVAHSAEVDQSNNRLTLQLTEDIFAPLEPNAILLSEGDTVILGSFYVQHAEQVRPDITVIAVPLLSATWYVDEVRRQHPDVVIPFDAYDPVTGADTSKLVDANIGRRPMYYVGVINDKFPPNYDEMRVGFARQFVPKGSAPDPFAFTREHLGIFEGFHYPTRTYPSSSWEAWEASQYGAVAFDVASALETVDVGQAEAWYERAIELAPNSGGAYRNLGILLDAHGGDKARIAGLLQHYLALSPNDPDAAAIERYLQTIPAASSAP
jgi:Protein of unknown function (DUF2723)